MSDRKAFPSENDWIDTGMTMLEWYAGEALAHIIDREAIAIGAKAENLTPSQFVAKASFDLAEAMVREAEKRREGK